MASLSAIRLRPGDTVVGRAPICDLPIDEPSISRRHVRFRVHGDHCVLTDLGGRNGTFVNGEQVTEAEVRPAMPSSSAGFRSASITEPSSRSSSATATRSSTTGRRSSGPPRSGAITVADFKPSAALGTAAAAAGGDLAPARPGRHARNLLERIASVALNVLPVDRVFVLLMDQQGAEVLSRVSRARNNRPSPTPI